MKKTKVILKIVLFPLIAFMLIYGLLSFMTYSTHNDEIRLKLFYNEPASSLDVVFIGPSTMRAGIIPTKIFEEEGLTSYVMATDTLPLDLAIPIIEESEIAQKPQIYVIDINSISFPNTAYVEYARKKFLNSVPNKQRKDKYIKKFIPKNKIIDYSLPLYANHYNWNWLPDIIKNRQMDIDNKKSVLKGFSSSFYQAELKEENIIDISNYTKSKKPDKNNLSLLEELLKYIKQKQLKVMFIKTPRFIEESSLQEVEMVNYVEKIIRNEGLIVKDYSKEILNLNLETKDFYDFTHLNVDGAIKFSSIISKDLIGLSCVERRTHNDAVAKDWNESAENVNKFIEFYQQKDNSHLEKTIFGDKTMLEFQRDKNHA